MLLYDHRVTLNKYSRQGKDNDQSVVHNNKLWKQIFNTRNMAKQWKCTVGTKILPVRGPYLLKVRYKRGKVMEWLTYILYPLIFLFCDEHVLVPHMSVGVSVIFPCDPLV